LCKRVMVKIIENALVFVLKNSETWFRKKLSVKLGFFIG
jgi:hypothetical protein